MTRIKRNNYLVRKSSVYDLGYLLESLLLFPLFPELVQMDVSNINIRF